VRGSQRANDHILLHTSPDLYQQAPADTMAERIYYREQILANCAILFPEPEKLTLLTVNESNKPRIFIISSRTGQLLLEYEGVENENFRLLLVKTQDMLAAHAVKMRSGPSPEKLRLLEEEEIATLRRENAGLREENAELKGHRVSVLERRVEELEKKLRGNAGAIPRSSGFGSTPGSSDTSR